MKILVLNSGSSSLKFILFEMNDESVLISGMVDRIGISGSILSFQEQGGRSEEISVNIPDFGTARYIVSAVGGGINFGVIRDPGNRSSSRSWWQISGNGYHNAGGS